MPGKRNSRGIKLPSFIRGILQGGKRKAIPKKPRVEPRILSRRKELSDLLTKTYIGKKHLKASSIPGWGRRKVQGVTISDSKVNLDLFQISPTRKETANEKGVRYYLKINKTEVVQISRKEYGRFRYLIDELL